MIDIVKYQGNLESILDILDIPDTYPVGAIVSTLSRIKLAFGAFVFRGTASSSRSPPLDPTTASSAHG